jgi:hypothetical protein
MTAPGKASVWGWSVGVLDRLSDTRNFAMVFRTLMESIDTCLTTGRSNTRVMASGVRDAARTIAIIERLRAIVGARIKGNIAVEGGWTCSQEAGTASVREVSDNWLRDALRTRRSDILGGGGGPPYAELTLPLQPESRAAVLATEIAMAVAAPRATSRTISNRLSPARGGAASGVIRSAG